ncbi:uncharacterized protein MELLADRAFT_71666 [Melampsora larici-populina 98AG31]|uniref:Uncharacterized protein n=1 Tax=Melampsora larici-populina (strain 98AG31 / pathotype 3-4-7) TaxID=747676 RepID=F4RID6_MELLP|nr:uncharacterized protein MELLADRAFT_71666 [Melampsora larici-populina 98AG31]EGG07683.1 hypothetical protein MELLADRAFT_71666 [Melampsora larici-populina 98AG31]
MVTNTRGNSRTTRASQSKTTTSQPHSNATNRKATTSKKNKKTQNVSTDNDEDSDFLQDLDLHDNDDTNESDNSAPVNKTTTSNANRVNARKKVQRKTGNEQSSNSNNSQTLNVNNGVSNKNDTTNPTPVFRSRFPGLEMDTFEESLDDWTVVALRQNIAKQGSTLSRPAPEIDALVKTIRLQYEKRMLMAALMGGLPEVVVWSIVGEGGRKGYSNCWIRFLGFCKLALDEQLPPRANKEAWATRNTKVSNIWKKFSDNEKMVFRDPFFFALGNLPDLTYIEPEDVSGEDKEQVLSMHHLEAESSPPKVLQLSEADRLKYQPIFDRLVDVKKLHTCHGQPEPTSSVATLQKRSLTELKKAHHDFSVVCQRYQITYYLTAVGCGSFEGWRQVYSNNVPFADWAAKIAKVPSKFATYIHGKTVSKEIEGAKFQQPSDERKTRLTRELNSLVDAVYRGNIFPKVPDPEGELELRGWPIRIIQKEGSLLSKDALKAGHRKAKDSTRQLWLKDIENKNFVIERKPEEAVEKTSKKKKKSKNPASPSRDSSCEEEEQLTQSQAPNESQRNA